MKVPENCYICPRLFKCYWNKLCYTPKGLWFLKVNLSLISSPCM